MSNFNQSNPLKNQSLNLVKLKGSVLTTSNVQNLVNDIISIIKDKIPNYSELKTSISLLENICILIENHSIKETKINKKDICIKIFITLFPEMNNELSISNLSKSIDEIVEISNSIVKIPLVKKISKSFSNYVKSKL